MTSETSTGAHAEIAPTPDVGHDTYDTAKDTVIPIEHTEHTAKHDAPTDTAGTCAQTQAPWKRRMWCIGTAAASTCAFLCLFMYAAVVIQRSMIYMPKKFVNPKDAAGLELLHNYNFVSFHSTDGTKLSALYVPAAEKADTSPTLLLLFGSNFHLMNKLLFLSEIYTKSDRRVSLFVPSYRGYGESDGKPSQTGLCRDAQASFQWLKAHSPQSPVIVYGHSLGGAVALDLVAREPQSFAGLILENTFTKSSDVVAYKRPSLRAASLLLVDTWRSDERAREIADYNSHFDANGNLISAIDLESSLTKNQRDKHTAQRPQLYRPLRILMLSGNSDRQIPPSHMITLRDLLSSKCAQFVDFCSILFGEHDTMWLQSAYMPSLKDYLDKLARYST